jgi:hypothetical protein
VHPWRGGPDDRHFARGPSRFCILAHDRASVQYQCKRAAHAAGHGNDAFAASSRTTWSITATSMCPGHRCAPGHRPSPRQHAILRDSPAVALANAKLRDVLVNSTAIKQVVLLFFSGVRGFGSHGGHRGPVHERSAAGQGSNHRSHRTLHQGYPWRGRGITRRCRPTPHASKTERTAHRHALRACAAAFSA